MEDQTTPSTPAEDRLKRTTTGFTERLGIKDDYAGDKIKDLADKAGFVGMIGCLILGFIIWSKMSGIAGFLLGFLIAGAGIFASFVLVSILYSYADVVAHTIEQTKILKRLEERKKAEMKSLEQKAEDEMAMFVNEAEQIANAEATQVKAEANSESAAEEEEIDQEWKKSEKIRKLAKIPLHGVVDARMRRLAHFAERSHYGIICPVCGRKQESERDNCYFCDCRFVYDDEPFVGSEDEMLLRLHRLMENKPG